AKMARKLRELVRGPRRVENHLWVYTPLVLPFPGSAIAAVANQAIVRQTVRVLKHRIGIDSFQLWTFLPTAVRFAGRLGESLLVYYCTDEWSAFDHLDGRTLAALERELCQRADIVFATSEPLWERKRQYNQETHLIPHGVDWQHFASALDDATPIAPPLRGIVRPIIGFMGLIHSWIDQDLLAFLANRRPCWTFVLLGKSVVDTAKLLRHRNIRLLGKVPYQQLPSFCKAFAVGLIPFVVSELTRNVNPIKLREYLSAGIPVVSTEIPEAAGFPQDCTVTGSHEAFLDAIERYLAEDSPEQRNARSIAMQAHAWNRRIAELSRHVLRVKARKSR
ncbi:MAG: glycosyltransferase, partial [Pseudomonadota bacterium]